MNPVEIVKYLHQDVFIKNPPSFTQKLEAIERLDSVMKFDLFLDDDPFNKTLFLTYIFIKFNWLMHSIISGDPDLYELTNLQFKVNLAKGRFSDRLSCHYISMIHAFLSSVAIYFCDKSSEAIVEFNQSISEILENTTKFWLHDFRDEFLLSRAPKKLLDQLEAGKEACLSCACDQNQCC
jgi:hypothetical protein